MISWITLISSEIASHLLHLQLDIGQVTWYDDDDDYVDDDDDIDDDDDTIDDDAINDDAINDDSNEIIDATNDKRKVYALQSFIYALQSFI